MRLSEDVTEPRASAANILLLPKTWPTTMQAVNIDHHTHQFAIDDTHQAAAPSAALSAESAHRSPGMSVKGRCSSCSMSRAYSPLTLM
jgi:hypothetical protein